MNNFQFLTNKHVKKHLLKESSLKIEPPFFLLVRQGSITLQTEEKIHAGACTLSVSAKQHSINLLSLSEDCELKLLQYDRHDMRKMSFQLNLIDAFKYVYTNTKLSFKLSEKDFEDLWFLADYIERQLKSNKNLSLSKHILRHLHYSFLYSAIEKLDKNNLYAANPSTQQEKLVLGFFQNLQEKGSSKVQVSDYAKLQNVTTRHLSATVKQLTGMTAQDIIHRLLLSKAKKDLSSTVKPISEIALDLGYTDPYTFSHFFKRNSGLSPTDFRKNHQD